MNARENYFSSGSRAPLLETIERMKQLLGEGHSVVEIAAACKRSETWIKGLVPLLGLHPDVFPYLGQYKVQAFKGKRRMRRVLPLKLALQIAKLPPENQLEEVRTLISRDNTLTVSGELRLGADLGSALYGHARRFETLLEIYMSMSCPRLRSLFETWSQPQKEILTKLLRSLTFSLESIAQAVHPVDSETTVGQIHVVNRGRGPSLIEKHFEAQGYRCDWSNWKETQEVSL